ncbi:MAG: hypothetical protein ACOH1Y_16910 [Propionicimonas sp.]
MSETSFVDFVLHARLRMINENPEPPSGFARMGWTAEEWADLDDVSTWAGMDLLDHMSVREWLRRSPTRFDGVVSPSMVREAWDTYGHQAEGPLAGYAAGATTRFTAAFLGAHPDIHPDIVHAWDAAQRLGLTEQDACLWALPDELFIKGDGTIPDHRQAEEEARQLERVTDWTGRFGETAYLWVLAGYTFKAASVLLDAGVQVDDDQLRAMAAANHV